MNRQVEYFRPTNRGLLFVGDHPTPGHAQSIAGTEKFVKWVAQALPKSTYVNIMPQYRVEYKAYEHPEIALESRFRILRAIEWAEKSGLTNLDRIQLPSGISTSTAVQNSPRLRWLDLLDLFYKNPVPLLKGGGGLVLIVIRLRPDSRNGFPAEFTLPTL
jgi:hypothetical protein